MSVLHILCAFLFSLISSTLWAQAPTAMTFEPMFISPPSEQVTKLGQNRQPLFVSNRGFVFVSKDRKYQNSPQIYFKDLATGREKRVTYQNGKISVGAYSEQDNKLFYTSSTDEEKETPFLLKKYLARFPSSVNNDDFFQVEFIPQEIYSSTLDGNNINRLTHFSGYDGFPTYLKKKDRIYFSRWKSERLGLYATSVEKHLEPWAVTKTTGHDLGLALSPSENHFVWSRFSPDFKTSQILLSKTDFKEPSFLTLDTGVNWSPIWHPNGKSVIYSARSNIMSDFDLFEVSADGNCKRQITSYEGDEFLPAISPDGAKLLFTSTQSGKEQIHSIDYPKALTCDDGASESTDS